MRGNAAIIFKKELDRFFSNKASAIAAIILPGLLIYILWSLLGGAVSRNTETLIEVANLSEFYRTSAEESGITVVEIGSLPDSETMSELIKRGEVQAFVAFPESFDAITIMGGAGGSTEIPQVSIYYDSDITLSNSAYAMTCSILSAYELSLDSRFSVNSGGSTYDLGTSEDSVSQFAVSLVPFMLLTLVFGSCMSVAAESIAGEKERGTIATMLATPVNRKDIARGKVFACSLIGLAIALSSIIGIFGSLPSILQGEFDASRYGAQEYALIALVVTSLTVLIVTAITIISTFAKSTKEAQTFLLPAMIVVMGIGVIGMLSGSVQEGLLYYIIPVYGSVESLIGILSFDYQLSSLIACFISNCAFSTIGVIVLERLFESENLMFAK